MHVSNPIQSEKFICENPVLLRVHRINLELRKEHSRKLQFANVDWVNVLK